MTFSLVENNKLVHPLVHTEEDFVCVCVCMCGGGGGGGGGNNGGNKDIFISP